MTLGHFLSALLTCITNIGKSLSRQFPQRKKNTCTGLLSLGFPSKSPPGPLIVFRIQTRFHRDFFKRTLVTPRWLNWWEVYFFYNRRGIDLEPAERFKNFLRPNFLQFKASEMTRFASWLLLFPAHWPPQVRRSESHSSLTQSTWSLTSRWLSRWGIWDSTSIETPRSGWNFENLTVFKNKIEITLKPYSLAYMGGHIPKNQSQNGPLNHEAIWTLTDK